MGHSNSDGEHNYFAKKSEHIDWNRIQAYILIASSVRAVPMSRVLNLFSCICGQMKTVFLQGYSRECDFVLFLVLSEVDASFQDALIDIA